jgi:PAS domain S-box-containing protein
MSSRFPMAIYWGEEGFLLYNDAWRPILGDKHPWALGRPAAEVWPEIWNVIAPLFHSVLTTGEATWRGDELLLMKRFGFIEECYFDYTFNPIRGNGGRIEGILNVVQETTTRVIGERRLQTLRKLGERTLIEAKKSDNGCDAAATVLAENPKDVPFAAIYLLNDKGDTATLRQLIGLQQDNKVTPKTIQLHGSDDVWNLGSALASNEPKVLDDLTERFGKLTAGAWVDDFTRQAVVVPLAKSNVQELPAGFLVVGLSPRLTFNDDYRAFVELVSGHIATAIANARAYMDAQKRAEALAEINRAKTTFFSNVSHEFRTPLTLLLGPAEEALADSGTDPVNRERMAMIHRNALRLQKLVNTLLDFSRIEAGRMKASYAETDLSATTSDLASVFRSLMEKGGLKYIVECPPLSQPMFVDRDMWEKIVFNLLSNAFKFTLQGQIKVELKNDRDSALLLVQDSGIGMPAEELPHVFTRFHRVEGRRGRTYEGTGIGLALVQELVKLHGGSISVESEVGRGTIFAVRIPFGKAHLPADRIIDVSAVIAVDRDLQAFVEEMSPVLPEKTDANLLANPQQPKSTATERARVVLAEDNGDMRSYLQRLLQLHYCVEAVPNGAAALDAARKNPPDIIVSDVMMPEMSGLELVQALRSEEKLRTIPIILLSARAGEEARTEGMSQLADDYLTKPFTAHELLARVAAHLHLARWRREVAATLREKEERLRAALNASKTGTFRWDIRTNSLDWDESLDGLFGLPTGQTVRSLKNFIACVHPNDQQGVIDRCQKCASEGADFDMEFRVIWPDGSVHWLDDKGKTFFDEDGKPLYMTGACTEITTRKANEDALLKSKQRFDIVKDVSQVGFWFCDLPFDKLIWDNRTKEHFWIAPESEVTIGLFYERLHPDDRERTRRSIDESITNHTRYDIEYRTVSPVDGREKWIRAIGQGFYDDKGQSIRFDGVTLDITENKQARENLERTVAERTEKLRETLGELESYSYSIVHDMRAPLRSMQGFANLLSTEFSDKLTADGAMYLQRISNSADRMDRLIRDVLSFSRVARSDLKLEPVDTHKLVLDILETYSNLRTYKDCIRIDGTLPKVLGNEAGLTQCFSNLIGNAVKFVAPGKRPSIHIWAELNGETARIFVEDKGIGIPEIAHARMFQLFQRANIDYDGTGIGLAIVKKSVERMGGAVGFKSQPEEGSTFWLELKLA